MTHEELRDRLLDLAYGELSPRDAREVEEHAASCDACGAELAAMRGTRRVMAALPVEPAPERGERILVAAAREAARTRPQRRAWPRWLWAAPVAAASLAAVVAMSLRLGAVRPPDAAREDPNALRGESPYATPAAPPGPAASPAAGADGAAKGTRAERSEPRRAAKKEAPPRVADEPRFATAPDEARAPAERARGAAHAAPPAEAAPPPSVAFAVPPPEPAPAAPPRAGPGAARGGAAADSAPAGAAGAQQELAETRREAAPARRAAKTMAAPEPREPAPRDRAVAAATADARRGGFDPRGMTVAVEGPTTLEAWRGQGGVAVAAPSPLEGRLFWAVAFTPTPGARPALTVFVEDGTFRAVASVTGK